MCYFLTYLLIGFVLSWFANVLNPNPVAAKDWKIELIVVLLYPIAIVSGLFYSKK